MVLAGHCGGPTKHSTKVALSIHHWSSQKQIAKFLTFSHFTAKALDFFFYSIYALPLSFVPKQCFLLLFCHLCPIASPPIRSCCSTLSLAPAILFILTDRFLSSFFRIYIKLVRPFQICGELPQHSLWMALATCHSSREV